MNVKNLMYGTKGHGTLQLVVKDYVRYLSLTTSVKENKTGINLVMIHGAGTKEGTPDVLLLQVCLIYTFSAFSNLIEMPLFE